MSGSPQRGQYAVEAAVGNALDLLLLPGEGAVVLFADPQTGRYFTSLPDGRFALSDSTDPRSAARLVVSRKACKALIRLRANATNCYLKLRGFQS